MEDTYANLVVTMVANWDLSQESYMNVSNMSQTIQSQNFEIVGLRKELELTQK